MTLKTTVIIAGGKGAGLEEKTELKKAGEFLKKYNSIVNK